jgi:hypothetical protein
VSIKLMMRLVATWLVVGIAGCGSQGVGSASADSSVRYCRGNGVAEIRKKCHVGDVIVDSFNYEDIAQLCDLSRQVVYGGSVVCHLAPPRETY